MFPSKSWNEKIGHRARLGENNYFFLNKGTESSTELSCLGMRAVPARKNEAKRLQLSI